MRILIFSDLHANAEALNTLKESYDKLWFVGDIVSYGPDVYEAIDFVQRRCTLAVRGNHDNAAVSDAPIGCSPVNEPLALATRDYTRTPLSESDAAYLCSLPLIAKTERSGATFYVVHGSPRDPLYEYIRPPVADDALRYIVASLEVDFVVLSHTHIPMLRRLGQTIVLNPGSPGQPHDGDWRTSCALWEDGVITFHRYPYDCAA